MENETVRLLAKAHLPKSMQEIDLSRNLISDSGMRTMMKVRIHNVFQKYMTKIIKNTRTDVSK
jgi:hypothetical protein